MTLVRLPLRTEQRQTCGMTPDVLTLAELLSVAALLGATIEYIETVKRRAKARRAAAEREDQGDAGRRGLLRLLLVKPR
jgi:hypothetical protein